MQWILYTVIFLYGIVFGSFLNVCIYRIPKKESLVKVSSHCTSCGYSLKWFDLIPLFSWLFLRGKCRKCGAKISVQYPLIEGANGVLWLVIFLVRGLCVESVFFCALASALLALSVIDARTYEIPFGFNVFIFCIGILHLGYRVIFTKQPDVWLYVIGFFAVSSVTAAIYFLSKGRAIGGGDVKLMAAAGLLLGWRLISLSFILGCILGAVVHTLRMKLSGANRVLAMGPYLSAGILLSVMFGERLLTWYFEILGITL